MIPYYARVLISFFLIFSPFRSTSISSRLLLRATSQPKPTTLRELASSTYLHAPSLQTTPPFSPQEESAVAENATVFLFLFSLFPPHTERGNQIKKLMQVAKARWGAQGEGASAARQWGETAFPSSFLLLSPTCPSFY
jgi:hypothetical protein